MEINKHTKISALIKENKESISAIASLAGPLEKLKNPVLRKLMASRVTIEEAAKMGGCRLEDFERVLAPLGFVFKAEEAKDEAGEPEPQPGWLQQLVPEEIERFDVREMLARDHDPLKEIMKRFKQLPVGHALCIINTFVPTPLVRLLEKDQALCYTVSVHEKEYHTYFLKQKRRTAKKEPDDPAPRPQQLTASSNAETATDNELLQKAKDKFQEQGITEIDVRHLEMPGPMEAILNALERLPAGAALFVHHKRVPVYLLEELEDKNYKAHIFNLSETDVKLLIEKY